MSHWVYSEYTQDLFLVFELLPLYISPTYLTHPPTYPPSLQSHPPTQALCRMTILLVRIFLVGKWHTHTSQPRCVLWPKANTCVTPFLKHNWQHLWFWNLDFLLLILYLPSAISTPLKWVLPIQMISNKYNL